MKLTWTNNTYTLLVKDVHLYHIDGINHYCFEVDKRDKNFKNYTNGLMWLSSEDEDLYALTKECILWINKKVNKIAK